MTDTATAVAAASIAAVAAPFVAAIAAVVIRATIKAAAAEVEKLTGVHVQQAAIDKLDAMAEAEAGALIAAAPDNLASAVIPVGSPIVAAIAKRIIAGAPAAFADAGLTPDHIATMVAGKLGRLQASMTTVAPAAPAVAAAPASVVPQ